MYDELDGANLELVGVTHWHERTSFFQSLHQSPLLSPVPSCSTHRVCAQRSGHKHLLHPTAEELFLDFQVLDIRGTQDQALLLYTAEPDSRSGQGLAFLSGWAQTDQEEPV